LKYLFIIGLLYFAYRTFRPQNSLNTKVEDEIQESDEDAYTDYEEIE